MQFGQQILDELPSPLVAPPALTRNVLPDAVNTVLCPSGAMPVNTAQNVVAAEVKSEATSRSCCWVLAARIDAKVVDFRMCEDEKESWALYDQIRCNLPRNNANAIRAGFNSLDEGWAFMASLASEQAGGETGCPSPSMPTAEPITKGRQVEEQSDAKRQRTSHGDVGMVSAPRSFRKMQTIPLEEYGGKCARFDQIGEVARRYPVGNPFIQDPSPKSQKCRLSKSGLQILLTDVEGEGKATVYETSKITVGGKIETLDLNRI